MRKFINVKFPQHGGGYSKTYPYVVPKGIDVAEGDVVVVENRSSGKYSVGDVTYVDDEDNGATSKVICKVDFTVYKREIENEQKRAKIAEEIEEMKSEFEQKQMLHFLAQSNSRAKELLEELENLDD